MSLIEKIYKSRNTALEMLKDRNYDISTINIYSLTEIESIYNSIKVKNNKEINGLDMYIDNQNKILVKYIFNNKIRISNIISIADEFIEENLNENDTLILILNTKSLNSDETLETYFSNIYKNKKIFCQYFLLDKITFNITEHVMVPKHIILSESEANEVLKIYSVQSFSQFPIIYKTDPVAKYLGMKEGQLCKIIRSSESAGQYINYRYCV